MKRASKFIGGQLSYKFAEPENVSDQQTNNKKMGRP
jgi:hypothetical protein